MDRQIVYPGQIPLETDLLSTNRNTMIGLGKLIAAVIGTGGVVNGLVVAPSIPAALTVSIGQGEIYSLQNVDNTAYSSLPADTTDTIVKQGIMLAAATLPCAAPTTSGFSINYLIEATYADIDGGSVVLPYYNASNPAQAYSGPGNSGNAQATVRQGTVSLQAKAGIAATTGTQTTPTVDSGYIALAVITVANGQTTITSGNIVASSSAQVLGASLLALINTNSTGRLLQLPTVITSSGTFTPNPLAKSLRIRASGAGAGGGGCVASTSSTVSVGQGGGCGAYAEVWVTGPLASSYAVVCGAPGVGVSGSAGTNGGASTFTGGSVALTLPGGIGGAASTATPPPFIGVVGANTAAPTLTGVTVVLSLPGAGGGGGFGMSLVAGANAGGRGTSNQLGNAPNIGSGTGGNGNSNGASGSAAAGTTGFTSEWIVEQYA